MRDVQNSTMTKARTRTAAAMAVLPWLMFALAGCATGPEKTSGVTEPGPGVKEPAVTRFEDGRDGFVITEVPAMDDASRENFNRAVVLITAEKYHEAIELLKQVIAQSPGVTAPYVNIALAYQSIDEPDRAEEHLKTALELFPDHPAVCNEYGLLYRRTGRFSEAKGIYEKALVRFPNYYPVHRNLGILCDVYLKDTACALEHYEIFLRAHPEDRTVALWLSDLGVRPDLNKEDRP